ncbi:M23 family metallopeptidase [Streptomyces sp. PU10]|uniref:murein hydrolase activator EnvC family protein n=2 Tax=unclassified Streptomyces TaxID=2593676 RepID=UPI0028FC6ABA|nr:M23 family metallopeptidase [Streptomyces sp. PU10]MDU0256575.1 M23 family metallopeptidase [Streptomyces sp. PU10]
MRTRRWVRGRTRLPVLPAAPAVMSVMTVLAVVGVLCVLGVLAAGPPGRTPRAAGAVAVAAAVSGRGAAEAPRGAAPEGTRRVPDPGVPAVARNWPVGVRPAVLRGWEPPATPYGPGHRGVDLAAAGGTPVRAVAAGRVSFAGPVAGRGVVSLELAGTGDPPLRTTYAPVEAVVEEGDVVAAGEVLGWVQPAGSHCTGCLHWGLLRGDVYLNPLSLLPPWLLDAGPSRLLPVLGVPLPGRAEVSPVRPAAPWRRPPP